MKPFSPNPFASKNVVHINIFTANNTQDDSRETREDWAGYPEGACELFICLMSSNISVQTWKKKLLEEIEMFAQKFNMGE